MLLFDASHTSHTRAQTGIQRVCRSLFAELTARGKVEAICHDPHLGAWRPLNRDEATVLRDRGGSSSSRGAKWTLGQKLAGHARRLSGSRPPLPSAGGLVCPELFAPRIGASLPDLFSGITGPRVALFHDAIGLKFPEFTPPATVARLPAYLRELQQFDGIAAVSEDSAASLREFWSWLGTGDLPPVETIPLGMDAIPDPIRHAPVPATSEKPRVLCVATIEGRKNHLALLDAVESLWREGAQFELELIGMPRTDTAEAALDKISTLRTAGRPLVYHGSVTEDSLHAAYARSTFTVYPSLIEGFGLPVLESLQHGKPCVCSAHGALGESARDGGCVTLPAMDAASLAAVIRALLREPARIAELAATARARRFRSWRDYTNDLSEWMNGLRVRA